MRRTAKTNRWALLALIVGLFGVCPVGDALGDANDKANDDDSPSYEIDLAQYKSEETIYVSPKTTFKLLLTNVIPGQDKKYNITWQLETLTPAKLKMTGFKDIILPMDRPKSATEESKKNTALEDCLAEIRSKFKGYNDTAKEAKSEDTVRDVLAVAKEYAKKPCEDNASSIDEELMEMLRKFAQSKYDELELLTKKEINNLVVPKDGQRLVVTIKREKFENVVGSNAKTWKVIFSTGGPPEYEILYGFTFITDGFNQGTRYFSRDLSDGSFQIASTGKRGYKNLEFAPTVFAVWYPKSLGRGRQTGLMAGLGAANDAVAVSFGCYLTFSRNIGVGAGLSLHKIYKLKPKYRSEVDRNIAGSLDFDQIHDKEYTIDPFLSVLFRFDESPFSSK